MEHRYNRRIPIKIKVQVYKKGQPIAIGQTRNLALTGMFLEMNPGKFTRHNMLEIEFVGAERPSSYHIPAYVVNCAADGYGLEFDTSINEVRETLHSLLSEVSNEEEAERFVNDEFVTQIIKSNI